MGKIQQEDSELGSFSSCFMGKIQLEDSELGSFSSCFMGKIQLEDSELGSFFNGLWERFNWKILNLEVVSMVYGKDSTGRF